MTVSSPWWLVRGCWRRFKGTPYGRAGHWTAKALARGGAQQAGIFDAAARRKRGATRPRADRGHRAGGLRLAPSAHAGRRPSAAPGTARDRSATETLAGRGLPSAGPAILPERLFSKPVKITVKAARCARVARDGASRQPGL
jgi:hypothetical protein